MADNQYDAIVVGSGISGGWAAKELTEKGLKVLLLERGRDIKHIEGYVNATKDSWEFPHRGLKPTQQMINDYPALKRDYPLNEIVLDLWAKDDLVEFQQAANAGTLGARTRPAQTTIAGDFTETGHVTNGAS